MVIYGSCFGVSFCAVVSPGPVVKILFMLIIYILKIKDNTPNAAVVLINFGRYHANRTTN